MAPAHKYMATTNKWSDKIFDFKNKLEEQELSEKTKNTYLRILIETLHTVQKPIEDITLDEFKEMVKEKNPHTKVQIINMMNKYKTIYDIPHDDWVNYRRNELDKETQKHTKRSNEYLQNLPTRAELMEYTNGLREKKDLQGYLINWLMINYYTRNMDLDLHFIRNKKELTNDKNYLFIKRDGTVDFIRNIYKTKFSHGTKTFTINDATFIKSLKDYARDNKTLLDQEMTETKKSKFIKDKTKGKLGEVMYLKAQIADLKDPSEINVIAEKRGTSPSLLLSDYNINQKKRTQKELVSSDDTSSVASED